MTYQPPKETEPTRFLHRVFDARVLPFGVDRLLLDGPALALEQGASTQSAQLQNLQSSRHGQSPTEYSLSGESISSTQEGDEAESLSSVEPFVVTPEMIEAGCFELRNYDQNMDGGTEFVIRLYRAMGACRAPCTPREAQ